MPRPDSLATTPTQARATAAVARERADLRSVAAVVAAL
jgi:hypothetical protein